MSKSSCANCGQESEGCFCPECGSNKAEIAAKPKFCANCGCGIEANTKFCASCGTHIEQSTLAPTNPLPDTHTTPFVARPAHVNLPGISTSLTPAQTSTLPVSQPTQGSVLAADEYIFYKIEEDAVWKNEYDIISVPEGAVVLAIRENEIGGVQKMLRWGQGAAMSSYKIRIQSAFGQLLGEVQTSGIITKDMELAGLNGLLLGKASLSMTGVAEKFTNSTGGDWLSVKKHGLTVLCFKHSIYQENSEVAVFDTIDESEGADLLGQNSGILNDKDVAFHLKFQFSVPEESKLAAIAMVYQAAHAGGRI